MSIRYSQFDKHDEDGDILIKLFVREILSESSKAKKRKTPPKPEPSAEVGVDDAGAAEDSFGYEYDVSSTRKSAETAGDVSGAGEAQVSKNYPIKNSGMDIKTSIEVMDETKLSMFVAASVVVPLNDDVQKDLDEKKNCVVLKISNDTDDATVKIKVAIGNESLEDMVLVGSDFDFVDALLNVDLLSKLKLQININRADYDEINEIINVADVLKTTSPDFATNSKNFNVELNFKSSSLYFVPISDARKDAPRPDKIKKSDPLEIKPVDPASSSYTNIVLVSDMIAGLDAAKTARGVKRGAGFGPRVKPCPKCSSDHKGVDLAVPAGTPILAVLDGEVVHAGAAGGCGFTVKLYHKDIKTYTKYCHMLQPPTVTVGTTVEQGAPLGIAGSTGASTGPHLHFETIVNGSNTDPVAWLKANPTATYPIMVK